MATKYFIKPNAWGIFCGMDKTARIDSRTVAEVFEKEHKNVIQSIENLKNDFEKISENGQNLAAENSATRLSTKVGEMFVESTYKNRGKKYKCYEMNRKGFTLLSMGFTGKKALQFQMEYINRFDEMEAFIKEKVEYLSDYPEWTDSCKAFQERNGEDTFFYPREQDMINKLVLGMTAKQFRDKYNVEGSIKLYCTAEQINAVHALQKRDTQLLDMDLSYSERRAWLEKATKAKGYYVGTEAQDIAKAAEVA